MTVERGDGLFRCLEYLVVTVGEENVSRISLNGARGRGLPNG